MFCAIWRQQKIFGSNSNINLKQVYYLSQIDMLFLPMVTNYKVGAIGIKVVEDTNKTVKTNFVTDLYYNGIMGRHFFMIASISSY